MKKLYADILLLAPEASSSAIAEFVKTHWHLYLEEDARRLKEKDLSMYGVWELDILKKEIITDLRHDKIFGFEELKGCWSNDELSSYIRHEILLHSGEEQSVTECYISMTDKSKRIFKIFQINRLDGATRNVMIAGWGDSDGKNFYGIIKDITDQPEFKNNKIFLIEKESLALLDDWKVIKAHNIGERTLLYQYTDDLFYDNNKKKYCNIDFIVNGGILIIKNKRDYESLFSKYKCDFKYLFVVPELNWEKRGSELEGYALTNELVLEHLKSSLNLQVKFLSLFEHQQILDSFKFEHTNTAKAFPHVCILSTLIRNELSNRIKKIVNSLSIQFSGFEYESFLMKEIREISDYYSKLKNPVLPTLNLRTDVNIKDHLLTVPAFKKEQEVDKVIATAKDELYSEYSPMQFELIKSLSLTFRGLAQKVHHDFGNLLGEVSQNDIFSEPMKKRILDEVAKLRPFEEYINFKKIRENILNANSNNELAENLHLIIIELKKILQDDPASKEEQKSNLSEFSVCIVEDDPTFREVLSTVLSGIFKDVYPSVDEFGRYDLEKLINGIKNKEVEYDIYFVDLLYENEGIWLPTNGLDVYSIIKRNYPNAAIRIVTGLPRDIIGKNIEIVKDRSNFNYNINMSHIFSKSQGSKELANKIRDFSAGIIKECINNKMRIRSAEDVPIPDSGPFDIKSSGKKVEKVKDLGSKIEKIMKSDPERYSRWVAIAIELLRKYINEELNDGTVNWRKGQLPGQEFAFSRTEKRMEIFMPCIMAHRLIVLYEMDILSWVLSYNKYYYNISRYKKFKQPISDLNKYLNTKLGINSDSVGLAQGDVTIKKEQSFFPHEREILEELASEIEIKQSELIGDIDINLQDWLIELVVELSSRNVFEIINQTEKNMILDVKLGDEDISHHNISTSKLTINYMVNVLNILHDYSNEKTMVSIISRMKSLFDEDDELSEDGLPEEIKTIVRTLFGVG